MAEKRKTRITPTKGKKSKTVTIDEVDAAPAADVYKQPWRALAGWFLGPRAENRDQFTRLTKQAIDWYSDCREQYYPTDPCYITEDVKASSAYRAEIRDLEEQMEAMFRELSDSIPFFSTRYQGHMTWECTLPSILGYFSGMLWNQNNVDSSASPVTTLYEIKVGQHLCQLMNFKSDKSISPWAHLTGCGSVANIEAMWAARNLKFHPIAVQAAVTSMEAGDLGKGATTPVFVPELDRCVPLNRCTHWQLLNLDVDTVCNLTEAVRIHAGLPDNSLIDEHLKKESIVSIGLADFMAKHGIKSPVMCSPGTNHYSWPKGATILGMGDNNVLPVNVDKNARQDVSQLKEKLKMCLQMKKPVIMVVAVIGSTEESAVDPLEEIYNLRNEFRGKGLNFSIHADAAWGGYLLTMIREPSESKLNSRRKHGIDFIPSIPLSDYAKRQYSAICKADTVTIDPHKAGFCQYPAGALAYRNGTMKGFITLQAPEVFHGEDDVSVGVYGLEGSKPGAAAVGVMLSHRVIGLDKLGYGRILGQCQLGSKLFYCMWMTVAEEYDEFVCMNFIDLPADLAVPEDKVKAFIRERILGSNSADLAEDEEAMKFLSSVGPDALINSFVVNLKGNTKTSVCNDLQMLMFNELNATVGQSPKRVPMFLTTSMLEPTKYGASVDQLKVRLGLPITEDSLGFLRNTCMNPFQCTQAFITAMGKIFRNVVLNCIGGLGKEGDPKDHHTFVVCGRMNKTGKVFVEYIPSISEKQSQYHVITTLKTCSDADRAKFRNEQKHQQSTYFLRTKAPITIMNMLRNSDKMQFQVFKGALTSKCLFEVALKVDEVFRYNHLESIKASEHIQYPEAQTYFLYGDKKRAYISHVITKHPDFQQLVQLDDIPHSITPHMLDLGVIVTIPEIHGYPLIIDNKISDPLQRESYTVHYKGIQYADCKTTITLSKRNSKKWFKGSL